MEYTLFANFKVKVIKNYEKLTFLKINLDASLKQTSLKYIIFSYTMV